MKNAAVPLSQVLANEQEQIKKRREQLEDARQSAPAQGLGPFGVCISGGGIRSATFSLGILQGLTKRGLLPLFDYLSTVSGGGYIGSWLHGVIFRKCEGDPRKAGDHICQISDHRNPKMPQGPCEDPVTFLRKYSNYLAPRTGLFSPDFWVIGIIWLRNMFLNQLILVPFLTGLVLVAILAGFLQQKLAQDQSVGWVTVGVAAITSLALAVVIISLNLGAIVNRELREPGDTSQKELGALEKYWLIWTSVGLVLLSGFILATSHYDPIPNGLTHIFQHVGSGGGFYSQLWAEKYHIPFVFVVLLVLFVIIQSVGGFKTCFKHSHKNLGNFWWLHLWIPVVCAAATTILLSEVLHWISSWREGPQAAWHTVAWGPPLVTQVLVVGMTVQIGLMGADFPDSTREWLARMGALLTISFAAWMALFAIGVFGPKWLAACGLTYGKTAAGAVTAWIATTAAGVYAGNSSRTGNGNTNTSGNTNASPTSSTSALLEWIGKIAPTVFLVGYLLSISFVVHEIIAHGGGVYTPGSGGEAAKPGATTTVHIALPAAAAGGSSNLKVEVNSGDAVPAWLAWVQPINQHYWQAYQLSQDGTWYVAVVLFLGCLALVLILPLRININEFSLHHFYKNRLVRCYLGASRAEKRKPNPFTGFDSGDDIPIAKLCAIPPKGKKAYLGPYPIVNTTLNLNAGSDLATQERKGASFIFSPFSCGFDLPPSAEDTCGKGEMPRQDGYRNTEQYMHPSHDARVGGPGIGTPMAISGAAANPNGGYHTSAPLAFLMTIFDVRLGWWVGNPLKEGPSGRPGPRYALGSLLSELFSQTTSQSNYLNLSDGGHFDNLGLYELAKRRCRYIIVCDGEADPDLNFESLGGAIRKCRADLGVEIEVDPKQIQRDKGFSRTHCVVGKLTYNNPPDTGWILYLKASLTGDEPEDVTQYHAAHPAFPHDPTADQFFTESQFESYRQLGLHVVESAFEHEKKDSDALKDLFESLYRHWYPPSTVAEGVATRHAEAYSALMKRMSDDPDLRYLDRQIIPRPGANCDGTPPVEPYSPAWVTDAIKRKAFFFCLDLIQLMENVVYDLHLYEKTHKENPNNGGWIRTFRHWTAQPLFQNTWDEAKCTFNPLFREFFESLR